MLMDKQDEEVIVSRGGDRDEVEGQKEGGGLLGSDGVLGEFEGPSVEEQKGVEADQISEEDVLY